MKLERDRVKVDYRKTPVEFYFPSNIRLTIDMRTVPQLGDHVMLEGEKWMVQDVVHHPDTDLQPVHIHLIREWRPASERKIEDIEPGLA